MDSVELREITDRLTEFAADVGDTPPAAILAQDGSASASLLDFRKRHNLTLDWMITGDGPKFRHGDGTAAAYRVLNMLRVCVRSLDGDVPDLPGDETATAQTLEVAMDQMRDVIDALEAAEARERLSIGGDSPVALYQRWQSLRKAREVLVTGAGGNDPETPELAAMDAESELLSKSIAACQPDIDADAAAMLEWVMADSEGMTHCDLNTQAQRSVVAYLRGRH